MVGSRVHPLRARLRVGLRVSGKVRARVHLGTRLGLTFCVAALLAMAVTTAMAERPAVAERSPSTTSRLESELARLRDAVRGPVHVADSARTSIPGTLPAVVILCALTCAGLAAYGPRLSAVRDPGTSLRSRSPPSRPC